MPPSEGSSVPAEGERAGGCDRASPVILSDRRGGVGVVLQTDHAVHAARIAAEWGAAGFFRPPEEAVEAVRLHDEGWREWERAPILQGGRLPDFTEMEVARHLEIWRRGVEAAQAAGPYCGLLVSRHAVGLYQRFFLAHRKRRPAEEVAMVEGFCAEEERRQEALLELLSRDPGYRQAVAPPVLEATSRLLAVWDRLSLALCAGTIGALVLRGVPGAPRGEIAVEFLDPEQVRLSPFPLRGPLLLEVPCRILPRRAWRSSEELRRAMGRAPLRPLRHRLVPLRGSPRTSG